jgi:hypothetical protein
MKAEYIAASEATKEVVWIRNFVSELGVVPSVSRHIDLYCHNSGAIAQATESLIEVRCTWTTTLLIR